jgi:hypothetical protein
MYKSSVESRYESDHTFRNLVDQMRYALGFYQFTPSELREAAMLASTMHEMTRVRPLLIKKGEYPIPYPPLAWKISKEELDLDFAKQNITYGVLYNSAAPASTYLAPKEVQLNHLFYLRGSNTAIDRNHRVCTYCNLSDVYTSAFNVPCKKITTAFPGV